MAATWISTKKNEKPIQNKMETDFKVKVKWKWNQFQSKIKPKPIFKKLNENENRF